MDLLWPALLSLTLYTLNLPLIALLPAMLLLHRVMARLKARPLETVTDLNVIIVGAGVSGLCMGKKLKEEGAKFKILEKSPRLGGTWWENTYPGCGCDVPSHLYSFSFLPNPDWSRVYSGQEEILNYLKRVAEKFNLVEHIQFGQRVTRCDWDPEACRWNVGTEKGVTFTARVLVSGQGALHVPKTPNFPDAESFTGSVMHTARWDNSFEAKGRRIGVVGTGASAVQAVPLLALQAEKVTVFQRTPCWSPRKFDREYPDWIKKTFRYLPFTMTLLRIGLFLRNEILFHLLIVTDYWFSSWISRLVHKQVRRNVKKVVKDPVTAAKLTPSYSLGCKRITPSDTYWKAFNRDNVELVTEPITGICKEGIVTAEGVHKVDSIIYATGFDLLASGYGFQVTNKFGKDAKEEFGAAPQGYLGICHPNYPNFYWLLGPGTGLGTNSIIFMIECQADLVVSRLKQMISEDARALHVKPEVMADYEDWSRETMKERTFGGAATCDAWYKNSEGYNWTLWPSDCITYWWRTRNASCSSFSVTR